MFRFALLMVLASFLAVVAPVHAHHFEGNSADLTPATFHPAPDHAPVPIVVDGKAVARVLVNLEQPSRNVSLAVDDLISHLELTTGVRLDTIHELDDSPAIVIQMREKVDDAHPVEGFEIRTQPNRVTITGNDVAGTAWGIFDFLERFVGVRWYWPEDHHGTSIVKRSDLSIPPVHMTDGPVFRKREMWPAGGPRVAGARVGQQYFHLRSNDSWPIRLIVHAPHDWQPFYKQSRPEIFQLRKDGMRDWSMLCYGNPLTVKTYLERIEAEKQAEAAGEPYPPQAKVIHGTAVTVSPADMVVSCRCDDCRKLWDESGGMYGSASRIMGQFVAKLGREVKQHWPEMTVIFLPYKNYTLAPEGIEFPDNTEIQICGMPGLAQYKDREINAAEQANIDAWVKLTGRRIQNWHYSCWPVDRTNAAYIYAHTIKAHYQANRDKTVGSFVNGNWDHWPRQHVSLYTWQKVMWNPDFDVDAYLAEFCRRMYGPATGTMHQLITLLADGWENTEWEPHVLSPVTVYEQSYPRENVKKIEALLATALEQARGDELATKRIEYGAGPLREFFAESKQLAEGTGIKPLNLYQVAEEPTIDGKLDDPQWQDIEGLPFVVANDEKSAPKHPTTVKAVWTRRGVTFGFHLIEPQTENLARDIGTESRDAALVWWNDNVEIFLDPTGKRVGYYQFIINPNGAIFDSIGKEDITWTAEGALTAAFVGDGYWSVELFVPYALWDDVQLPETGAQWYGNFTRHRVTDRKDREYQGFNVTTGAPSHNQNAFGPWRFIER